MVFAVWGGILAHGVCLGATFLFEATAGRLVGMEIRRSGRSERGREQLSDGERLQSCTGADSASIGFL